MSKTPLELYTDNSIIMDVIKHNFQLASNGQSGELRFNHAFIDLEKVCNLLCKGCYLSMDNKNREELKLGEKLSYGEIKGVIDFAKERNVRTIVFAGAGETTLDRKSVV